MRRIFATTVLMLAMVSCANEKTDERVAASASPSACPSTRFEAGYLPKGVNESTGAPVLETYDWVKSWSGNGKLVQALGGISADRGDDPSAKDATVHGQNTTVGPISTPQGTYTIVDWTETNTCGRHQYAVATKGLSDEETVRIADSLEESTAANY